MVAETKDNVTQMFENMTESFRVVMDAGRRSQETMVRSMNEFWRAPAGFDTFFTRTERAAKEFVPFVGKSVEVFTESFDNTVRTNMDMFKTAAEASMKSDDTDVYRRTRQMWDAAFGAFRANVEMFGKASTRAMENWSNFCKAACCEDACSKSTVKPTK